MQEKAIFFLETSKRLQGKTLDLIEKRSHHRTIDAICKTAIIRIGNYLHISIKNMKNKERNRLASILKDLQVTHGCSNAAELARRIGIPEQRFRSYMRGQNSAQGESLTKIEKFMGLREGELWEKLYAEDGEIQSASELVPLFKSLSTEEKKSFLKLAMEAI